jgi:HDOD domain
VKIPTRAQAEAFLAEAERMNPTPWASHARCVAMAAENIARATKALDPDIAYILGLAHDIGRREGWTDAKHLIDGYKFFTAGGFDDAARVCLTHSFPDRNAASYFGTWDVSSEDKKFIEHFIASIEYDEYDRLIQLCDALALPSGFCLLEKRLVDVALRYPPVPTMLESWRARMKLLAHFDALVGGSIYLHLPGAIENTFQIAPSAASRSPRAPSRTPEADER